MDFQPDAAIHFAGLKSITDSLNSPMAYYRVNVSRSINLLSALEKVNCKLFLFSSSATVYGTPLYLPIDEGHPIDTLSPYGRSKLIIEEILKYWAKSDAQRSAIELCYFNSIGAHVPGAIGEAPQKTPNNLMPILTEVATESRPELIVFW